MLNVGTVFSEMAVGFPTLEVTTTLSFQPSVLESISVTSILIPLTALLNVNVVVTADSPDPDLGSRFKPNVLIPPKVEFSILGYPKSQSTSEFSFTLTARFTPDAIFEIVPSSSPSVHNQGSEPQFEEVHSSVSPVVAVPLSPASIYSQLSPSVDTCQCRFVVPVAE